MATHIKQLLNGIAAPLKQLPPKRTYQRLLEFRCHGKLVFSGMTDTLPDVISIGKAQDNCWVIPKTDRVAAEHHAVLELGKRRMTIRTLDGNDLYVHGQPQKSYTLKHNDRIALGDCELFVKPADVTIVKTLDFHRLEFCNGTRAGDTINLKPGITTIGSSDDNDLVLKDTVVSRKHAEIRVDDNGEVWIHALACLNGTFVNGKKLGAQERMLMDMDDIAIAFYDFKFLDRKVYHERSQFLKKILVMALTVLVIIGIAGLFYAVTPKAGDLRMAAVFYIRRAEFDKAQQLLDKMPNSRGFEHYKAVYLKHLGNIARYRKTMAAFRDFKEFLAEEQWQEAAQCFGRLELNNRAAWSWEDSTVDERMEEVNLAKRLLDQILEDQHALVNVDTTIQSQQELLKKLENNSDFIPAPNTPQWILPLYKELENDKVDFRKTLEYVQMLNEKLAQLTQAKITYEDFVQILKNANNEVASVGVFSQVHEILMVTGTLHDNLQKVNDNEAALLNLEFGKIVENIDFASYDKCQCSPACIDIRENLLTRQQRILACARELPFILAALGKAGYQNDQLGKVIQTFVDKTTLSKALACIAQANQPAAPTSPVDAYDRMFGIQFFYDIITQSATATTNAYGDSLLSSLPFIPECVTVARYFNAAEQAATWLELPEHQMFLNGKIGTLHQNVQAIMEQRKSLIKNLADAATAARGTKEALVARAAVFYFSPIASIPPKDMETFSSDWAIYRNALLDISESYDRLDLKATQEARAKLIRRCIPGDPLLTLTRVYEK